MRLRFLAAGAALVVLAAGPALAIEQIHIPDSSAAPSSGAPDALFDKSVPANWQEKTDQNHGNQAGGFHFSVTGGSQSNAFGQILSAPDPRILQLAMKLSLRFVF